MSAEEIKKDLSIRYEPGEVLEVRMLPKGSDRVMYGYYDNLDKCADDCYKMDGIPEGIYITINPCKPELLARANNRLEPQKNGKGNSTTEPDILKRKWLMFDIDAIRPAGISSSDQEHELAINTAYDLNSRLKVDMGFPEGIIGDSGNGAHNEYRIDLPNDKDTKTLLEAVFKVITTKYNNVPGIDIQTFADANRIWKLKGTKVCKGDNMPDRPHRRSKLLQIPENIEIISIEMLRRIADMLPKDTPILKGKEYPSIPIGTQNGNGKAWTPDKLESWLKEHGAVIERTKQDGNINRFILRACLYNSQHEGNKEAEVHIGANGMIGYKCHHNSCKDVSWIMVREKLDPKYKKGKEKIIQNGIRSNGAFDYIDRIFEKNPIYYDEAGQFWIWNDDGYYTPVDNTEILLILLRDIADPTIIQTKFKGELLEAARLRGRDARVKPVPTHWIHVQNGVYDIKTGELTEATPDYLFTDPIPHNISDSEDTPTIDKLFSEWVEPKKVKLLHEIVAYCIHNGYPIHRMFILYGRGRNGKGQYRDFIVNLVGCQNRTASTLEQLINSRFETARLFNKKICTMGEINYTLLDRTAILKMLSGGDPIPGEKKNKEPFDFVNTAKLLINTNSLPQTSDKTDAFYSRCVLLEFGKQFQLGKNIIETIPDHEYNNYLTKSLKVLRELLDRGEFTNEGDIRAKELEYERLSNPLTQFINTFYEKDIDGVIATWRLMERYTEYCSEKGFRKPRSKNEFNDMLKVNYEIEKKNLLDVETNEYKNWMWLHGFKPKNKPEIKKDVIPEKPKEDLPVLPDLPEVPLSTHMEQSCEKLGKMGKTGKNILPIATETLPNDTILGQAKTGKNDSELTQQIRTYAESHQERYGEINSSQKLTEFSYEFVRLNRPKTLDGIQYTPMQISAIAASVLNIRGKVSA